MRLSEATVESVQFAALLHDIGMIGKDDLLDRPVLTDEEAESLRDHVKVGAEIARELSRAEIGAAILHHHERYDGSGYPNGLKGDAIPIGARIIAIAEVVDSMRFGMFPYGTPAQLSSIMAYIEAERGRAFDPEIVDALARVLTTDFSGREHQHAGPEPVVVPRLKGVAAE